jgi:hypothetical protein
METMTPTNPIPDLKSENASGSTKMLLIAPAMTPEKESTAFLDACLAMIPNSSIL